MSGVVRASRVVPFPRVTVAHAAIIWSVIVPLQLSAQAEPPLRTLRPEFRLSAEQHNLSALGSVAEGPDGVLAVPQGQDHQIRLFSKAGVALATVGRRGGGPGEFQSPGRAFWRGDTLWVRDATLNLLSAFDRNGRFLLALPLPAAFSPDWRSADGKRLLQPTLITRNRDGSLSFSASTPTGEGRATTRWLVVVRDDGRPKPVGVPFPTDACFKDFENSQVAIPYCARAISGHHPQNGIVVTATTAMHGTRPATVHVLAQRSTGELIYSRDISVPVTRVSADELAEVRRPDQKVPYPAEVRDFLARTPAPDARPPFINVTVGPDGSAWFIRSKSIDGHYEYFGLDPGGAPIGRIRIREDASLQWASRDVAWVVERDDDGFETLVRYRIVK